MTNQRNATLGQLSAIGFKISGTTTRVISDGGLSFDQANTLVLSNEQTLEKLTETFCIEILGVKVDPWAEEKKRIERFYKKFFHRFIDWTTITLPAKQAGINRLEFVSSEITEDQAFAAYLGKFDDACKNNYNSITGSIVKQQERPTGDYVFCHVGGDEPDMLGTSYNDGINTNIKFMVPKEGIIAAFRYRVETGKMYDAKGKTCLAALVSDDYVMCMHRYPDGQFNLSMVTRVIRYFEYGLRQVRF